METLNKDENLLFEATTTLTPEVSDNSSGFIIIPIAVLFGTFILSALVYIMVRKRKRIAHIYCKHRFNARLRYEDEDSDVALLKSDDIDDPTECLLKGKLQIDSRYESYQTTEVAASTSNMENERDLNHAFFT